MTPKETLKHYFGYDEFRYPQEEIINEPLKGNDIVGVMRTGFGKSVCYQIPAIILDGMTLVISPLISLMKDQTDSLKAKGIRAEFLNSSISLKKQLEIEKECIAGNVKLLYISPERVTNKDRQNFFKSLNVSLIAHDESHLSNTWKIFRPAYNQLSILREIYPGVPVMAVTATSNREVTKDICEQLKLKDPKIFKGDFDRSNISIEVNKKGYVEGNITRLLDEISIGNGNGPAIIYCYSKKDCSELSYYLNQMTEYKTDFYHAGLKNKEKNESQEKFMNGDIDIIVATEAFAMGIDKSNVRLVINHTIPKSIITYYQRIGRAGRDDKPSRSVLFYSPYDIERVEFLIKKTNKNQSWDKTSEELSKLHEMVSFCTKIQCRRQMLLEHFEQEHDGYCKDKSLGCDVCGVNL